MWLCDEVLEAVHAIGSECFAVPFIVRRKRDVLSFVLRFSMFDEGRHSDGGRRGGELSARDVFC